MISNHARTIAPAKDQPRFGVCPWPVPIGRLGTPEKFKKFQAGAALALFLHDSSGRSRARNFIDFIKGVYFRQPAQGEELIKFFKLRPDSSRTDRGPAGWRSRLPGSRDLDYFDFEKLPWLSTGATGCRYPAVFYA